MTHKEDRPGWTYYTARKKIEEMLDELCRLNFRLCRDENGRITDSRLNTMFVYARDRLDNLAAGVKYKEIKAIERKEDTQ